MNALLLLSFTLALCYTMMSPYGCDYVVTKSVGVLKQLEGIGSHYSHIGVICQPIMIKVCKMLSHWPSDSVTKYDRKWIFSVILP